jgi:predicted outer membrane repeat protein
VNALLNVFLVKVFLKNVGENQGGGVYFNLISAA